MHTGRTVSLSRPLDTEREPDNPEPADHHMTLLGAKDHPDGVAFAKDYIGVDYHNDSHSHLDALCHVSYDDSLTTAGRRIRSRLRARRLRRSSF